MRRKRPPLQPSTFPFVAVLLCAMGGLILFLLVLDRRAKVVARAKAQEMRQQLEATKARKREAFATAQAQQLARQTEEFARQAEEQARRERERRAEWEQRRRELHERLLAQERELRNQKEKLTQQQATAVARTTEELTRQQQLLTQIATSEAQLQQLRTELSQRSQLVALTGTQADKNKTDLLRMHDDLAQLEKTLSDLKTVRAQQTQTFSLIPYAGRRGESRQPLYVECSGEGIIIYPEHKLLAEPDLSPQTIRQELDRRLAARGNSSELKDRLYIFVLVRPEGLKLFYTMQDALVGLPLDFGYELLDSDWVLDLGDRGGVSAPIQGPMANISRPFSPVSAPNPGARSGPVRGLRFGTGGNTPGGEGTLVPPPPPPGYAASAGGSGVSGPGNSGSVRQGPGLSGTGNYRTGNNQVTLAQLGTGPGGKQTTPGLPAGRSGSGPGGNGSESGTGLPGPPGTETGTGRFPGGSRPGSPAGSGQGATGSQGPGPEGNEKTGSSGTGQPGNGGQTLNGSGGQGTAPGGQQGMGTGMGQPGTAVTTDPGGSGPGFGVASGGTERSPGSDGQGGSGTNTPPAAGGSGTGTQSGVPGGGQTGAASGNPGGNAGSGSQSGGNGPPGPAGQGAGQPATGSAGQQVAWQPKGGEKAQPGGTGVPAPGQLGPPPAPQPNRPPEEDATRTSAPTQPNPFAMPGAPTDSPGARSLVGGNPGGTSSPGGEGLPSEGPLQAASVRRPVILSRQIGNRDWIIALECRERSILLRPLEREFPLATVTGEGSELAQTVQQLIARKQAGVRPGEPPYRPILRFEVGANGLRAYYLAERCLEMLHLPMVREGAHSESE